MNAVLYLRFHVLVCENAVIPKTRQMYVSDGRIRSLASIFFLFRDSRH